MESEEIKNASRQELIDYLESWGYQCYDYETDEELREAAILNEKTERE